MAVLPGVTGLPARFAAVIDITPDGCWAWTGSLTPAGYGQAYLGAPALAHRATWTLLRGPVPTALELHHLCGVRACVNPDHLVPLSSRDHHDAHVARRDACSAGHPWTPGNTYVRAGGTRQCRQCKADRQAAWRLAHSNEDVALRTARRQRARA